MEGKPEEIDKSKKQYCESHRDPNRKVNYLSQVIWGHGHGHGHVHQEFTKSISSTRIS